MLLSKEIYLAFALIWCRVELCMNLMRLLLPLSDIG